MKNIELMPAERGRTWLPVQYGQDRVDFSYPSVRGTHQECFEAIAKDPEITPAEGIELALLTHGAYTGKDEWESIKQDSFINNCVRAPVRFLWLPKSSMKDKGLSGVSVQREVKGEGLSIRMAVPNLNDWKEENGIYFSPDRNTSFVSSDKYELGKHNQRSFAKDGIARAVLSPDGAEIFAKTAYDAKKTLGIWGVDSDSISEPKERVGLLGEYSGRLILVGSDWDDFNRNDRAFGVRKSREASAPKK